MIDEAEFYSKTAGITKANDVTQEESIKIRNAQTIKDLQDFYEKGMSNCPTDPLRICIRHLIERLDECNQELTTLYDKGAPLVGLTTDFLTRP